MNKRIEEINNKILKLKQEQENIKGTECEIWSRIVGYYRNIKHWNEGKSEEYKQRKNFKIEGIKYDK